MADIQLIQCKNQQKTSTCRRNTVPYKEIEIKESNDDVRTLTDTTWYGARPQPRRLCVRRGPRSTLPQKRGHSPLPNFQPISFIAKQLHASRWHLVWR